MSRFKAGIKQSCELAREILIFVEECGFVRKRTGQNGLFDGVERAVSRPTCPAATDVTFRDSLHSLQWDFGER